MAEKESRNSNIELLRLVLMYFVIMLHYNGMGGGVIRIVKDNPLNSFSSQLFEGLCVLAVNCFMIISGYFLYTNKKIKTGKILDLILVVIFYHYVDYALRLLFTEEIFSLKSFIGNILPYNYFMIFYVVSYMLSPFVAQSYQKMDFKQASVLTFILAFLFLLIPTVLHLANDLNILKLNIIEALSPISTSGDNNGYTVVQFMVDLCIGIYLRKLEQNGWKIKWYWLLGVFVLIAVVFAFVADRIPSVDAYCNIAVVLMAVCFFLLFKKMNFKSKVLNYFSKSTFAIFCIHTGSFFNNTVWKKIINYENLNGNVLLFVGCSLLYVLEMFALCLALSIVMRAAFGRVKNAVCNKMPVVEVFDE